MARLQHRGGVLTPSVAGTVCSRASLMWEWVRKGGFGLQWREHNYTKMQLWKKQHVVNTWPNIKFKGTVCFCFQTKTFISSFGCLQFWKHRRSLLPLEAFAAFGLFCFVVWLASTFCAWQCWRVTTIKNHSLQVVQTCWNASSKAVWSSSREAAQTEHLFTAVWISGI